MKTLLGIGLALVVISTGRGGGFATVEIEGNEYTNISEVHISGNGGIFISAANGMTVVSADKLPDDFLKSWNINKESATSAEKSKSEELLQKAIDYGSFREVDGIVYDIRNPESGWVRFPKAKVFQVLDDGAIVDITPDDENYFSVHVKNLPTTIGDTDTISFIAKLTGNYSYINKLGDDRTIRDYDMGRVCSRHEIPESVLTSQKAFDALRISSLDSPSKNIIATLPESSDLKSSGSGFFITADGYLISNYHVVKDATKVRLVTSAGTIDAKIVQVDTANDLALLKAEGKFSPLPIATSRAAHLGATVATIGFPDPGLQGFSPKLAKGEIASLSGIQDDPHYFQISVPVQPGNSGGALVDEHGNVIGIVSAKLDEAAALAMSGSLPENVNYAVKSSFLLSFLESVPDVEEKLAKPNANDENFEDVVKSSQDAAALVLVY